MPASTSLLALLERAESKPCRLASAGPGAALALSMHCLMIKGGFSSGSPSDQAGAAKGSVFKPPASWLGGEKDVWTFQYVKDGKDSAGFTLIVSVHGPSGRVFCHASEDGNLNNIQVLGLQLDNYVPNPAVLNSHSWQPGTFTNEDKLEALFHEYILAPLVAGARDMSPTSEQAKRRASQPDCMHAGQQLRQQLSHSGWEASLLDDGGEGCGARPYASYLAVSAVAVAAFAALAGAAVVLRMRSGGPGALRT